VERVQRTLEAAEAAVMIVPFQTLLLEEALEPVSLLSLMLLLPRMLILWELEVPQVRQAQAVT
jgi:hypothetical protein